MKVLLFTAFIINLFFFSNFVFSHDDLMVEDYQNKAIDSKQGSGMKKGELTPEQQKLLQESLKKGKKYLQERKKFLEELDNEGN